MRKMICAAAFLLPLVTGAAARATDISKTGIYQISEINILPAEMKGVPKMFHAMASEMRREPGLIQLTITQEVGEPYNYTVIEQWQDQDALNTHMASNEAKAFNQDLQPLLSGPVYQRVFSVFQ
jgi:quinol monooxygenase YgiN